jgi:phage gp45-like
MLRAFGRLLDPLRRQLAQMLMKGLVVLTVEARPMRTVQATLSNPAMPLSGVDHYEPFGFTSAPLQGAVGLFGTVGGNRGHTVMMVCADPRYRPTNLQPGDSCIFDAHGSTIWLSSTGIVVTSPLPVTVNESMVINGSVATSLDVNAAGNITAGSGASGSFLTLTGQVVTVSDGLITNIF